MKTGLERIAELEWLVEKLATRVQQLEAMTIPNLNIIPPHERVEQPWPQPFLPPPHKYQTEPFWYHTTVIC